MKTLIFLTYLIITFNCKLTRHSDDVLKREKIFIEAHRCLSHGQKNHNTKESIIDAINNGIEAIETDVWLTSDNHTVLFHDFDRKIYNCKNYFLNILHDGFNKICDLSLSKLQECETIEGKNKIPLLEDIMKTTKGKIFMNLEIKDTRIQIWEHIQELIEKYEYYDQISISSFNHDFFQKIQLL